MANADQPVIRTLLGAEGATGADWVTVTV